MSSIEPKALTSSSENKEKIYTLASECSDSADHYRLKHVHRLSLQIDCDIETQTINIRFVAASNESPLSETPTLVMRCELNDAYCQGEQSLRQFFDTREHMSNTVWLLPGEITGLINFSQELQWYQLTSGQDAYTAGIKKSWPQLVLISALNLETVERLGQVIEQWRWKTLATYLDTLDLPSFETQGTKNLEHELLSKIQRINKDAGPHRQRAKTHLDALKCLQWILLELANCRNCGHQGELKSAKLKTTSQEKTIWSGTCQQSNSRSRVAA